MMGTFMEKIKKKQYIWEYLLEGEGRDIHFEQAVSWNPYAEVVEETEQGHCIYNAMYRYEQIFLPYFEKAGIPASQKDKVIFDICSHFLGVSDIRDGFSYKEYLKRELGQDIEKGMYGERVAQIYEKLSVEKKYLVIHYLEQLNSIMKQGMSPNACMEIYKKVLIQLLETGVLYRDRYHDGQYILYVGENRGEEKEKLIYLAQTLFLPLDYQVTVLWDKHFGLLGEQQTLKLDEIRMM